MEETKGWALRGRRPKISKDRCIFNTQMDRKDVEGLAKIADALGCLGGIKNTNYLDVLRMCAHAFIEHTRDALKKEKGKDLYECSRDEIKEEALKFLKKTNT